MSSIWDDDEEKEQKTPKKDEDLDKIMLEKKFDPKDLVTMDAEKEKSLILLGLDFQQVLGYQDALITGAFLLADFTPPDLDKFEKRKFLWKDTLLPQIREVLKSDIELRNSMSEALNEIATLAIVIKECAIMVNKASSPKLALELAKTPINEYYQQLEASKSKLSNLKSAALSLFEKHYAEILEIVGPNAADFVKRRSELDEEMKSHQDTLARILREKADLESEQTKYDNLIPPLEMLIRDKATAIANAKSRAAEIESYNRQSDQTINSIPDTIPVTVRSSSFFGLCRSSSTYHIKNPDKQAQRDYYTELIRSRDERLKSQYSSLEAQEQRKLQLEKDLASYKEEQRRVSENLQAWNERSGKQVALLKENISLVIGKIQEFEKTAAKIETDVGLGGSTLISCLSAIKVFGQKHHKSNFVHQPLINIITTIQSMLTAAIRFLNSPHESIAFIGGKSLLKNAGFLAASSHYLKEISLTLDERQKTITTKKFAVLKSSNVLQIN